jgi:hypothetical protein
MYRNIAFIGKARSGKDTAAARLVANWAFTRVAFADPLKGMALSVDPWIDAGAAPNGPAMCRRLSELVDEWGWERAKDEYPEVRQVLQRLGASVRYLDEDFWLNIARRSLDAADTWNMPVVVTDCRYPNEAEALRKRGFLMVEIRRHGAGAGAHASETALDGFRADAILGNETSIFDLHAAVDALVTTR